MDKELYTAIMALPQMKERLKKLYEYAEEKHGVPHEGLDISLRLTSKTVVANSGVDTGMDINNKLRELLDKPL
jgi:hypothetical protein